MRMSDCSSDVCSSDLLGQVDRQLVEVGPDPVTLCVVVGEGAAQQHLVGRQADARHGVARREGRLLDLSEEILRVAVERHRADPDQRSEEHTYELQSLMRNTYAVFCLKTKTKGYESNKKKKKKNDN